MKIYGQVQYQPEKRQWKITCEAYVSMRLKRLFPKLGKGSVGTHYLSDTAENVHELQWFLLRYPMEVSDQNRMRQRCSERTRSLRLVDEIMAEDYVAPKFDLAEPARDYQARAAALFLARNGLLLGDDVGLGKTVTSICALADPRTLPAAVVTLTALPPQWRREINRFMPGLNVHVIKRAQPYDLFSGPASQLQMLRRFPDVVILNYHKLAAWAESLVAAGVKCVIYDECQELRKGGVEKEEKKSAKYIAAEYLAEHVPYRLGLSATPIYNYGIEFFSVMKCLCPSEIGTKKEFAETWTGGSSDDKATIKNPKAFGSFMRDSGMMLRRTKSEVGRELPEAQIVLQYVQADSGVLNGVSDACAELARLILSEAKEQERGERMHASEELSNRLRQATGIAKAPYVAEFVRLLIESGEKVLLYGWHRAVYSIWLDKLKDFNPVMYTGSESVPQKEAAKEKFISGDSQVMLMSLRAGAGVDGLQKAGRIVVFGELDWSPGVHEQNIGRILRDGQKHSVMAYYLVSEDADSADPTMIDVLGIKKQQIEGVRRNPGEESLVAAMQTDGGHIRRLAEAYLRRSNGGV